MRTFLRRAVIAMLIGVALYGVFVAYAGYSKIKSSLEIFHYSAFIAALGLALVNYLARYFKWEYYLKRLEIRHVRKFDSLLIFLSGFVLTVTPGKVGEVFKCAVLKQTHGVPAARTAPIVVAERMTDVIGVIILIVVGSAGFHGGLPWAAAGTTAVAAGLTLILWRRPVLTIIGWIERGPERLRPLGPKLHESFNSLRILASPGALLCPAFLSVIGWGAEGVGLDLLLRGFGGHPSVMLSIFFYATATLAGAVIPVPGGLGITETMIQQQLVEIGHVGLGVATSSMILIRFSTLWFAVVIGFLALTLLRGRYPSLQAEGEPVPPQVLPTDPSRDEATP